MAAPFLQLTRLPEKNRTKEYLSGGYNATLSPLMANAIQVLSRYQDDLNKEFSDKAYDEMLLDPAVAASVDILKGLILAEPLRVVPRIQDKKDPEYEQAHEIAEWVEEQIWGMNRPPQQVLWEALECVQYGSSLVEIVMESTTDSTGKPILKLVDLKTRNRANYALIVDRYFNVLGAVSVESGYGATSIYTGSTKPDPDKVIPREKFLLLALQTKNSDPRGISLIRPAWNPYYVKTQVYPQYLKFLVQFASPSIIAYTPETAEDIDQFDADGQPVLDADGIQVTVTPEEDLLATMLGFQSGTVAALRGGSKVDLIQSTGDGNAFAKAFEMFDRQIAMAILKNPRTLLEAQHGSKADSEASQDVTDVFISGLREIVSALFTRDVVRTLVTVNFGREIAEKYAPEVSLTAVPKQDFAKSADAVAKLWTAKLLHVSQVEEVMAMLGLPEIDMDAFQAELDQEAEMRKLDQEERMKLLNPGAGTTSPKDETPGPSGQGGGE